MYLRSGKKATFATQTRAAATRYSLAATVDAAACRIVQESLTNVRRHAAAMQVYLAIAVNARTRSQLIIIAYGSGLVRPGKT